MNPVQFSYQGVYGIHHYMFVILQKGEESLYNNQEGGGDLTIMMQFSLKIL